MNKYEIHLKTAPAMYVVSCLITIPVNAQAPELLGAAFHEVWEHIHQHGATAAGTNFTRWHQGPEIVTNEVVETIVPVSTLLPSTDRIRCYRLDAQEVVSAVHEGDFEEFAQLHPIIVQWALDNGYELEGGYREIYIKHDPANFSDSVTEVQFPLK